MNKISVVIALCILCAVFTVSVAATNKAYFTPQQSNATYCNTTIVDIWANATGFAGGVINLTYNPTCLNVTNWARNNTNFPYGEWVHYNGRDYIDFYKTGSTYTGKYMIGTLTVHCVNQAEECEAQLTFFEPTRLKDDVGVTVSATWINGTFTCGELQSCLGTCCNDAACSEIHGTDMSCKDCLDLGNKYWHPNKDSACFDGASMPDLYLNYCPECTDGTDNDLDSNIDFPSDLQCTCGLDPSEVNPLPPIPEASSLILLSTGLCALLLVVRLQRKK